MFICWFGIPQKEQNLISCAIIFNILLVIYQSCFNFLCINGSTSDNANQTAFDVDICMYLKTVTSDIKWNNDNENDIYIRLKDQINRLDQTKGFESINSSQLFIIPSSQM